MAFPLSVETLNKLVDFLKGSDPHQLIVAVRGQIAALEEQLPAEILADWQTFKNLEQELLTEINSSTPDPTPDQPAPVVAAVAPVVESTPPADTAPVVHELSVEPMTGTGDLNHAPDATQVSGWLPSDN